MVTLEAVRKHNSTLKKYGPNLVAVFGMCNIPLPRHADIEPALTLTRIPAVGGTSGIGESTAREFVRETISPRVYLAGRNESRASRIIEELRELNPDGSFKFVQCDAARLKSVDEACQSIQQQEDKVNLLFMTAGVMTTKGPDGIKNLLRIGNMSFY